MIVCLIGFLIIDIWGTFRRRRDLRIGCCVLYRLGSVQSLGDQVTLYGFDSGSCSATCSLRWLVLRRRRHRRSCIVLLSVLGHARIKAGLTAGRPHPKHLLSTARRLVSLSTGLRLRPIIINSLLLLIRRRRSVSRPSPSR